MRRSKIFVFAVFIFYFLFLILSFCSLAQTPDELYERAVNKYFLGNNQEAIELLNQVLQIDPNYTKAKALLSEIKKETGVTAPPKVPTITLPPTPVVAPTSPSAPSVTLPKVKPKAKPEAKPKVTPPPSTLPPYQFYKVKVSHPFQITWKDILWIAIALLTLLYLAIRLTFFYVKVLIERRNLQICSECKASNPSTAEFCSVCGARLKPWVAATAAQKKWYAKFGWQKNPFTLDIYPKLFTGYQTQVNTIFDKIYLKTGHILITGQKGTGKTTLLKWLTETLAKEFHTVYIPRPSDNFEDLLEYVASSLKIKKGRKEKLTIYDMEAMASKTNKNILLFLDEAHEFKPDFERPLRTLGDLNGVNFVLAGLPEAVEKFRRELPPFYDRIIENVELHHLTLEETIELIRKRIENVGGSGIAPFTPEAIENIYKMSGGMPRLILKVCDWVISDAIHHNVEVINPEAAVSFPKEEE